VNALSADASRIGYILLVPPKRTISSICSFPSLASRVLSSVPNDSELPAEVTQLTFGVLRAKYSNVFAPFNLLGALFGSFGALLSALFAQSNSLHLVPEMDHLLPRWILCFLWLYSRQGSFPSLLLEG
jgi:hypothetical protein